jgi:hypothetical protein
VFQLVPTEEARKEGAADPEEKLKETHGGEITKNQDDDDELD